MAGADLLIERRSEAEGISPGDGSTITRPSNHDRSYYGGGVGIDIGHLRKFNYRDDDKAKSNEKAQFIAVNEHFVVILTPSARDKWMFGGAL